MVKIAKKLGLIAVFTLSLGVFLWIAPAFAHAATYAYSAVSLADKLPELEGAADAVRIKDRWVILTSRGTGAASVTKLYTYQDQLREATVAFPERSGKGTYVITKIGNFYDNLTIVAARYARPTDTVAADYHFYFADDQFGLWEVELADDWIIRDVFYGPQSPMFLVQKKATGEIQLYNYLWKTKEKLLVSSFTGYDSVRAVSNDQDEWLIRTCLPATGRTAAECSWFTYSADKVLRVASFPYAVYSFGEPRVVVNGGYDWNLLFLANGELTTVSVNMQGLTNVRTLKTSLIPSAFDARDPRTIELLWNTDIVALLDGSIRSVSGDRVSRFLAFVPGASGEDLILYNAYDADTDGVSDDAEVRYGSDMKKPDTDMDGTEDLTEIARGMNPAGPCQIKAYIPGDFKYGRGYVNGETHACYMAEFDTQVQKALGKDWMTKYGVHWDKYADYVFGYIYGDYPINTLIGAIKRENGFSAIERYAKK